MATVWNETGCDLRRLVGDLVGNMWIYGQQGVRAVFANRDTYNAKVAVNSGYSFVGAGLQKLAGDEFLQGKDNTIFAANADGRSAVFNGLDGVFDLRR